MLSFNSVSSNRAYCKIILFFAFMLLNISCSVTRYVPQDKYLLKSNEVVFTSRKNVGDIDKDQLSRYIIQRPNSHFLGTNLRLGIYSITDTTKTNKWHKFWLNKVGQPPVVLDTSLCDKSSSQMEIYLASVGFLRAEVSSSVTSNKRRKAVVKYTVKQGEPYRIRSIDYNISDKFLETIMLPDTVNSLIRVGQIYDRSVLDAERSRISSSLNDMGFWGFGNSYISYKVDSSYNDHTVSLVMNVKQRVERVNQDGKAVLANHPIYRIRDIKVNTDYDPTMDIMTRNRMRYDTMYYRGLDLVYWGKMYVRPKIIANAIRLTPSQLYDAKTVNRTYSNIRTLNYNANILFAPVAVADSQDVIQVTTVSPESGRDVSTQELSLDCFMQCSPVMRQNISTELELSTTEDYYSAALKLGYQNRNLFRGAESFNISFRGAYELMKQSGRRNSFEFGVTTSLEIPRFWLPISNDAMSKFTQASTKMSVAYNIQRRPYYQRSSVSVIYGYGWTMNNGARFTINPADVNVIDVPWVDQEFLASIDNIFLRNTYQSQLIAGLSATYYYNTSTNPKQNAISIKVTTDVNGNLFRLIAPVFGPMVESNSESYYKLFGLRFAQYARAIFEISQRANLSDISQVAWRFLVGGAGAYGNSNSVPFERRFFAGGNNSMRGWQPRTLGPGSVLTQKKTYPDQLGNIRLEANLEYRISVVGPFGIALFADVGNIWNNEKGEKNPDARFKFNTFYKQLALDAGLGVRYDLDFVILRLDWGWKLHNPNLPVGDRWFSQLKIKDTALHFAIGLPF